MMTIKEGVTAISEGLVGGRAVRVSSRAGERVLVRRGSIWTLRKVAAKAKIKLPATEGEGAGSSDPA